MKPTNKKQYDPAYIGRFKYIYKRYKCTKCTASLTLKFIEINGGSSLRVTAYEDQHDHAINDERQLIFDNLERIKKIVKETPTVKVAIAGVMIANFLNQMIDCQKSGFEQIKSGKMTLFL